MANERIIQSGVMTPTILVGTQASSGGITFDASSNTIVVGTNLRIRGNVQQVDTINSTFTDNVLTLNKPLNGNPSSAPTESGIEIALPAGPANYAAFKYKQSQSAWVAETASGTAIKIKSNTPPTQGDDLTNKTYVDGLISTLTSNLSLDLLNDVIITSPQEGHVLKYVSGQWRNALQSGVTSVALNSPSGTLLIAGSPVTSSGTISVDLQNSGVTSGTYTNAAIVVDNKGRVTSASSTNMFQRFVTSNRLGLPTDTTKPLSGGSSDNNVVLPIIPTDSLILAAGTGMNIASFDPDSGPNAGVMFGLQNSGVAANTYTSPIITVDQYGRITSATNGIAEGISIDVPTGTDITNKNSISLSSSTGTIAINGTSVTNINFGLAAIHGGGVYENTKFTIDQYGRVTAMVPVTPPGTFGKVDANTGSITATYPPSTFEIVGATGSGITTSVSGNKVLINSSGAFQTPPAFTQDGYARFTGGLIIQWGRFTGTGTKYFPLAFPTAVLGMSNTNNVKTDGDSVPHTNGTNNITRTGFNVYGRTAGNPFYFIAIGY